MKNVKEIESNEELLLESTYIADVEVEDILYDIEKTRVQMKFLKDHEDKCKEHLKQFVGNHSEIIDHNGHTLATWSATKNHVFDTAAFKRDYPDLYNSYLKEQERRTLLIKGRPIE